MKKISMALGILLLASACSAHHSAPAVRPESLINSSVEKTSFPIKDASSLAPVEKWIADGSLPTGAEIYCGNSGSACDIVKKLLVDRGVRFNEIPQERGTGYGKISLLYSRIQAHNCITDSFGCSTSMNSINMTTNQGQLAKPGTAALQDAVSAVKILNSSAGR